MDKEDVVHIHNGILLSHKKNEMMPYVAIWMDLQVIIEVKSVDRERQISYDTANMQTQKSDTHELIHKIETNTQILKANLRLPNGTSEGNVKLGG